MEGGVVHKSNRGKGNNIEKTLLELQAQQMQLQAQQILMLEKLFELQNQGHEEGIRQAEEFGSGQEKELHCNTTTTSGGADKVPPE
jgi:hypothetical protein